ncbi:Uncharacterised protein [Candidatus Gugararchaeum adminiculabundum]|nr:Uncharacterised protein [Candidatus Gugararchaeum adminiculabundum]
MAENLTPRQQEKLQFTAKADMLIATALARYAGVTAKEFSRLAALGELNNSYYTPAAFKSRQAPEAIARRLAGDSVCAVLAGFRVREKSDLVKHAAALALAGEKQAKTKSMIAAFYAFKALEVAVDYLTIYQKQYLTQDFFALVRNEVWEQIWKICLPDAPSGKRIPFPADQVSQFQLLPPDVIPATLPVSLSASPVEAAKEEKKQPKWLEVFQDQEARNFLHSADIPELHIGLISHAAFTYEHELRRETVFSENDKMYITDGSSITGGSRNPKIIDVILRELDGAIGNLCDMGETNGPRAMAALLFPGYREIGHIMQKPTPAKYSYEQYKQFLQAWIDARNDFAYRMAKQAEKRAWEIPSQKQAERFAELYPLQQKLGKLKEEESRYAGSLDENARVIERAEKALEQEQQKPEGERRNMAGTEANLTFYKEARERGLARLGELAKEIPLLEEDVTKRKREFGF